MKLEEKKSLPFLYGAQYYRAPTPAEKHWDEDLHNIKKMGCNIVKFWVQWRWSERREEEYFWDDLDILMELADKNGLKVVLNLILDVAPIWLERDYPKSLMEDRYGNKALTQTYLSRQIGGYPGPCYSNESMRSKRERFARAAIKHFKSFPALFMWDAWNEPENHSAFRAPDEIPELCHCVSCKSNFIEWLEKKYQTIERLNSVWGRCYSEFSEVELPYDPGTINDFIDWREFHLNKLTLEADWRLKTLWELDPERHPHLHTVPNTGWCFNTLTCVDDFALSRKCSIFGASMMNDPQMCAQAVSSAHGKYFYNAEWHINYGGLSMFQRVISRERFLFELLPQLGWGVKGLLFWQYRPESLGTEAPAWGLVNSDGSKRKVTEHAEYFIRQIKPHLPALEECSPQKPRALIWRSNRNDLFQFCRYGNYNVFREELKRYSDALYKLNIPFGFVNSESILEDSIDEGVSLLILPQMYYMNQAEANALDLFIEKGGVVLSEGNLAAYNSDTGRHSEKTPGLGLAEKWGVFESETTSSWHLPSAGEDAAHASGDVQKALETTGVKGSEFFPLTGVDGDTGFGALDFAQISGGEEMAHFKGVPCIVRKEIGNGALFYCGTHFAYASSKGEDLFYSLLKKAAERAGIQLYPDLKNLRVDKLFNKDGELEFIVCSNTGENDETLNLPDGTWHDVFGRGITLSPQNAFLFSRKKGIHAEE